MLLTPPTEWEAFANEWIELGGEGNERDEVDDLVVAVGNWGSQKDGDEPGMMED